MHHLSVEHCRRKRRGPLAKRFIVTKGTREGRLQGRLSKLVSHVRSEIVRSHSKPLAFKNKIELKYKYKERLILDASTSFGSLAPWEWADLDAVLQNDIKSLYVSCFAFSCVGPVEQHVAQASEIAMLVGSVANDINSFSSFFAGLHVIVDHQRINGTLFVFSASLLAPLAVSALEGINRLWNLPSIFLSNVNL